MKKFKRNVIEMPMQQNELWDDITNNCSPQLVKLLETFASTEKMIEDDRSISKSAEEKGRIRRGTNDHIVRSDNCKKHSNFSSLERSNISNGRRSFFHVLSNLLRSSILSIEYVMTSAEHSSVTIILLSSLLFSSTNGYILRWEECRTFLFFFFMFGRFSKNVDASFFLSSFEMGWISFFYSFVLYIT